MFYSTCYGSKYRCSIHSTVLHHHAVHCFSIVTYAALIFVSQHLVQLLFVLLLGSGLESHWYKVLSCAVSQGKQDSSPRM